MIPTLQLGQLGRNIKGAATGGVASDPYFSYVKALLHFNGTNNSTTITDEIPGHSWACLANARLSTSLSKWGSAAATFDGTSDSVEATSSDFAIGTGDFTDEFWIYPTALPGTWVMFDQRPNGTQGAMPTIYATVSTLKYFTSSADRISGGTIVINTWQHVALCRASGTTRLFLNGTQVGSSYADSNNYTATRIRFGTSGVDGGLGTFGSIDDYRRTVGVARYTANFTPPTAEFPNS